MTKKKFILNLLMGLTMLESCCGIVFAVCQWEIPVIVTFVLIGVTLVTLVTMYLVLWRCPKCKHSLAYVDNKTHCPYCGKKLDD